MTSRHELTSVTFITQVTVMKPNIVYVFEYVCTGGRTRVLQHWVICVHVEYTHGVRSGRNTVVNALPQ